jgi:hypothetical protein
MDTTEGSGLCEAIPDHCQRSGEHDYIINIKYRKNIRIRHVDYSRVFYFMRSDAKGISARHLSENLSDFIGHRA